MKNFVALGIFYTAFVFIMLNIVFPLVKGLDVTTQNMIVTAPVWLVGLPVWLIGGSIYCYVKDLKAKKIYNEKLD